MDTKMKDKLKECFSRDNNSSANCYGALPYVKKNLEKIDFNDASDMKDMIDIVLRALNLDESNIKFAEFLVSQGFDINYKLSGDNCLLLEYMKDSPKLSVIKQLIELGADVYSETMDGDNMLSVLSGKEEELAVSMVEAYDLTQFDKTDKFGATPLMYAVMRGYVKLVKLLIEQGFDVNGVGCAPMDEEDLDVETDGVSPLALAIQFGDVEIVQMLLDAGADEMLYDAEGNPPIFSLVRYPVDFFREHRWDSEKQPIFEKKKKIISLLEYLDLTDANGYSVLMKSLFSMRFWFNAHGEGISPQKNLPIALELIKKGADINTIANDGKRPLHQAVVAVEEVARELVKAGADINAQDNDGNTPLICACMEAKEETVLWLLKAGADYKILNNEGKNAKDIATQKGYSRALEQKGADDTLLQACKNNQSRAVQVLLKGGNPEVNIQDESGSTPLIYACKNNAPGIVKLLIDNGADVNISDQENHTPLHFAAALGSAAIINLLVKAGADVNYADSNGSTPLMFMAKNGRVSIALNYIKNPEVDVRIKNNQNATAVTYAIASKQMQLVKALLPCLGEDVDDADINGNTLLHYACYFGQLEIVKLLLETSRDSINKATDEGETPLIMAVRSSNFVIAKLLLEAGAAADCSNLNGLTPLHLVALDGNIFMGKLLLEAGADIDEKTKEGQTPLMYALTERKAEFAEFLIEKGADVNAVDNGQFSVMYYATDAELPQIVELLLKAGAEN